MVTLERNGYRLDGVVDWAQRYKDIIHNVLEAERKTKIYQLKKRGEDFTHLLPDSRWLSEMQICTALVYLLAPQGFEVYSGSVLVLPDVWGYGAEIGHLYFYKPATQDVVCLTPGQFIEKTDPLVPGERIQLLQQRDVMQRHIKPIGKNTVVLCGKKRQIQETFGLLYR